MGHLQINLLSEVLPSVTPLLKCLIWCISLQCKRTWCDWYVCKSSSCRHRSWSGWSKYMWSIHADTCVPVDRRAGCCRNTCKNSLFDRRPGYCRNTCRSHRNWHCWLWNVVQWWLEHKCEHTSTSFRLSDHATWLNGQYLNEHHEPIAVLFSVLFNLFTLLFFSLTFFCLPWRCDSWINFIMVRIHYCCCM